MFIVEFKMITKRSGEIFSTRYEAPDFRAAGAQLEKISDFNEHEHELLSLTFHNTDWKEEPDGKAHLDIPGAAR